MRTGLAKYHIFEGASGTHPRFTAGAALPRVCLLICLIAVSGAYGAEAKTAKRVLLISTGSRFSPGFTLVDQTVLEALKTIPEGQVETYGENLDILRFPSERFARIFRDYLTDKYAEKHPDLVILVYIGNLGIAGKMLQHLFPGTPVIVAGFTEEEIRRDEFGSMVSGTAQRVDPRASIDLILRLQPETRRIVVIGGTAEVDRGVMNSVKEAARSFAGRVDFDFWDNRSMAELRHAVGALPAQTAILFSRMFRDSTGQAVVSSQVARSIGEWANVPVYVMTDTNLGTGAVGGAVASVEAFGKRAGELARLMLTGTAPASLPFEIRSDTVPMFDGRALQRWGISESRLPPNSIIRFRPQSLWEQYRWTVLGALVIFALQAALISGLLIQRRRRRRADGEVASLAGRLITAQEAERSRIARDLHDDINQQLASLSIALSGVRRRLQHGEAAAVQDEIIGLQQRIIDVTNVTRQLSHELHPGVLQHAGLVPALKGHCAEFGAQHGINVTFCADGLDGVPQEIGLCLYRVAQEALRNIAAHAGARQARVALTPSADGLELVVNDDGQGFDLAEARRRGGVGLISVEERVRLIGGALRIESRPKRGTELRVRVPIRKEQNETTPDSAAGR
jgi:signal transduction histidine kinase